ncbi:MAG: helix-turn-helix domain-containing protein [Victivallales bacterium]|nr:helix-turn-helix domain-containing protein [Victivallales bacterium]
MFYTDTIKFNGGGIYNCAADWSWRVTGMRDYDLWLVLGGKGLLETQDKSYDLIGGDCFVISPGSNLKAGHSPENPLRVVAIHFDRLASHAEIALHPVTLPKFHRRLADFKFIEQLMVRAVHAGGSGGDKNSAALWTSAALYELESLDRAMSASCPSIHETAIERICSRISADPAGRHNIRRLAASAGMCPDHFGRVFRSIKGVSPREFIIGKRIDSAKVMLIESSHPIGRVAELCGYDSIYYFSRHFKTHVGVPPIQYRSNTSQDFPEVNPGRQLAGFAGHNV